jgi:hypothetical protein
LERSCDGYRVQLRGFFNRRAVGCDRLAGDVKNGVDLRLIDGAKQLACLGSG